MVSYVRRSGPGAPASLECFEVCDQLARCTGVELRNSDDWCELQIPLLRRTGFGNVSSQTDWMTGSDAAAELAVTGPAWNSINSAEGSPRALTMAHPQAGFYCWGKVKDCTGVSEQSCDSIGRYPCQESYIDQLCGPCLPLHVASDSSDPRSPGAVQCVPDPTAVFPTLKVALASPWFGGRQHEEALYLSIIYGVKKAWADRKGTDLIPIPLTRRMPFGMNISGHSDQWGYSLSAEQLSSYGIGQPSWDTRMENHPMSGIRAMAALMQDEYTAQYGLMEPADIGRTRPHCIIGSTPDNSNSGVFPHSIVDKPISHVATFYETPVLGWSYGDKEFADKTNHAYYLRVNRVGLDYHLAISRLIQDWGYTRVAVVTSGTSRAFVRGLQDRLGSSVELLVEDMNMQNPCQDVAFSSECHTKLIDSLARLRDLDARVIIHEQDGMTQLDNYWAIMLTPQLFRNTTLNIQFGTMGDCRTPMIPPTDGSYGLAVLWENIRLASNLNNRGFWDQMPGNCRVCPNWAFRDLPAEALSNWTRVATYNFGRTETIYTWSSFCPELPTLESILNCSWCNATADFWITPACTDELDRMRDQLQGTLCVGVEDSDNATRIDAWADYLSNLTAEELVAAGAPQSFFDVFEAPHPLFASSSVTMADKWAGTWRQKLREKAALLDSLLLSIVAFNQWVKAAGDSTPALSSTALRTGFRTVHNTPIVNWLSVVKGTRFDGVTGPVEFNAQSERLANYMIYSAQGPNLAYDSVAQYSIETDNIQFFAPVRFNGGTLLVPGNLSTVPPDREPPCNSGFYYNLSARGCVTCEAGFYCVGARIAPISCGTSSGHVAPRRSMSACVPCPAGSVPNAGFTGCVTCPQGLTTNEAAEPFCQQCSLGTRWDTYEVPGEFAPNMAPGQMLGAICRPCARGEYQDERGQTGCKACTGGRSTFSARAVSIGECLCPENTFLGLGSAECIGCPVGMQCKLGSDMANLNGAINATAQGRLLAGSPRRLMGTGEFPKLLPRYWASQQDPLSVYLCRSEASCPGGAPTDCPGSTDGIMCAACKPGFFSSGDRCVACSDVETSKMLFPVLPCILGPLLILALYAVGRTPVSRWSAPKQGIVVCGVIVLVHFQVMGLLWQCSLFFPPSLGSTWGRFNQVNKGLSMLRLRCAGVDKFSERYYLNVVWPVMLMFFFVFAFFLSRLVNFLFRKSSQTKPVNVFLTHRVDLDCLISTYGSLYEALFIGIAVQSLTLFHCYKHPNDKESLHVAPEVLCDSKERQDMLVIGILALLVYVGCSSALMLWVLCVAPSRFTNESFQKRWKFLLAKYRPDIWWWGIVVLARSLLLSMSVIILKKGAHQLIWISAVLIAYGFLTYSHKPWRHLYASRLDYMVCSMLTIAACAMLHFAANPSEPSSQNEVGVAITTFTHFLSFIPMTLGAVAIVQLGYRHLLPSKEIIWREGVLQELTQVAALIQKKGVDASEMRSHFAALSDYDWETLQAASDVLNAETTGLMTDRIARTSKPRLTPVGRESQEVPCGEDLFKPQGPALKLHQEPPQAQVAKTVLESPRSLPDEDYYRHMPASGKQAKSQQGLC